MTSEDCAFRLTSEEWTDVEELTSDHKNADTKMLLYAKNATILHGNVIDIHAGHKYIHNNSVKDYRSSSTYTHVNCCLKQ